MQFGSLLFHHQGMGRAKFETQAMLPLCHPLLMWCWPRFCPSAHTAYYPHLVEQFTYIRKNQIIAVKIYLRKDVVCIISRSGQILGHILRFDLDWLLFSFWHFFFVSLIPSCNLNNKNKIKKLKYSSGPSDLSECVMALICRTTGETLDYKFHAFIFLKPCSVFIIPHLPSC